MIFESNDSVLNAIAETERRELCGRTLGDYRIERRVGGGATSDVFLATQISLGRRVALKILKDDLANDETYLKRFLQEARAAARLEHPNIVRIYEVGSLTDDDSVGANGGRRRALRFFGWLRSRRRSSGAKTYRFIAQEFIEGASLRQFLRRNGSTSIPQTLAALEQIASALKRAADAGVVHRDVKPENVLLDANGTIKVVDFGLAWIAGSLDAVAATALTRTGFALGTPLYMSPEQARGKRIDFRSDVYSLGIVAYQMLTGAPPFRGETPLAVVLKHLNEKPRPILERRPDVPFALAALVERMIKKDPNDRPASIDELIAELRAIRRDFDGKGVPSAVLETPPLETPKLAAETSDSPSFEPISDAPNDAPNDAASASFFQSDAEREAFERNLSTTILSRRWQENWSKLDAARNDRGPVWTRRRVAVCALTAVVAFAVGGGILLAKNRWVASRTTEPPLTIKRFDSVEEQWVFALRLGTIDAWKSVVEFFPDDEYWKSRAEKQLALVYANEKNVPEAVAIFEKTAASPGVGRDFDPFGLAGLAWAAAENDDFERSGAILSELRVAKTGGYDRLTETLIEKTRRTIQNKIGVDVVAPRSFGGFNGGESSASPRNPRESDALRGSGIGDGRGERGPGRGPGGGIGRFGAK